MSFRRQRMKRRLTYNIKAGRTRWRVTWQKHCKSRADCLSSTVWSTDTTKLQQYQLSSNAHSNTQWNLSLHLHSLQPGTFLCSQQIKDSYADPSQKYVTGKWSVSGGLSFIHSYMTLPGPPTSCMEGEESWPQGKSTEKIRFSTGNPITHKLLKCSKS